MTSALLCFCMAVVVQSGFLLKPPIYLKNQQTPFLCCMAVWALSIP